jgi:EAL domain-containing protein (putative c-di-GMP-specific phosphodiesterase class I)/FixJ family two-component response regulator
MSAPVPIQIASVLIVDDSITQRTFSAALCRRLGIATVYEAGNGREALALLPTLAPQPCLMIVDLEMPTMDGPELLHQLQLRGIDIPIIVGSSHGRVLIDSVHAMGSVLGLQVLGAIQKPLREETLRAALQNLGNVVTQRQRGNDLPVDAAALREAIDGGQIKVHYQPKVDIRTGIARGVEALARWQHPTLGWVPPSQFVPLAEQNDLIHELTIAVMNEAMLQTASWEARGLHLSLAINLSPVLLERSDLVQEISDLQQCHGLAAEQVTLEVTESSLVKQLGVALGVLARLRMRGFGLSIDDYGTGFSSMQQLARIPFTELKIDRSFVHGAHERENLQVILRSALEMANDLGLVTVAEGVETLQDWRLLQEFGCTLGQGWLIARAMPAGDVARWVKAHRARRNELRMPASAESAARSSG